MRDDGQLCYRFSGKLGVWVYEVKGWFDVGNGVEFILCLVGFEDEH